MAAILAAAAGHAWAQAPGAGRLWPNLESNIERPLRYRPDGQDFVIENGAEFFNRPLYGGNTAFRVDAGDKPEFVLYLPGRGGNLRFGLQKVERVAPNALSPDQRLEGKPLHQAKWLHEAAHIASRYRAGTMLYEILDPLLGSVGVLHLEAIALHQTDGFALRAEARDVAPGIELVWAYGGVNGQRGVRDGDIGTERVPIGEWFQLQPAFCTGNRIEIDEDGFTLRAALPREQSAVIRGLMPAGAKLALADAKDWADCAALVGQVSGLPVSGQAGGSETRPTVVTGRIALQNSTPLVLGLQRVSESAAKVEDLDIYRNVTASRPPVERGPVQVGLLPAYKPEELPAVFVAAREHFAALRGQIRGETPDPFINAAVAALNVAADAVWDEPQGAVMHGAIAWRTKLLGWRGPYAMDALGWHDRARRHLSYWATRQNTDPIPDKLPPPDANANLARSEAALHSNGDMSNSHYDMNLVYIDALFRHLLWTGDVYFARKVWPVIERHLAWERRLFRREFEVKGEKLPLYEAYAAIWASDDLQYHGGGTAHASAYNHWHNLMAARVAQSLGHDPAPYEREAELIARGMRELLWTGTHFAEFKDLLGRQLVHPSAGLWTFYHAADSHVPGTAPMADYVLAKTGIPIRGPGVPDDRPYAVLPSTDWLPYKWSINNVVMGENIHTALGLWQSGRPTEAFTLMKSALLASMFMGICPGNVGSMNYLDVYRRESQRDFADGNGVTSRAIVEGLFGLRPDALAGELVVAPGWPEEWARASLRHPRLELEFTRDGQNETYVIRSRFARELRLRFHPPAGAAVVSAKINGEAVAPGREWRTTFSDSVTLELVRGEARTPREPVRAAGAITAAGSDSLAGESIHDAEPVSLAARFNDRVTEIFKPGKYVSPRSPFVSLALPWQGLGAWAGHVNATAEIDDSGLRRVAAENGGRLVLPDGVSFATPGPGDAPNILFVSQWDNYPAEATVPLAGRAKHLSLLMAGSTNHMQSRLDNGEVIVTYADGTTARLALRNPETWWPIEEDYFIDDYQFRMDAPLPVRVDLKTGRVRVLDAATFKGQGGVVPGGAATVLGLALDPDKELRSLTVRALANEVVIGLMAATLVR